MASWSIRLLVAAALYSPDTVGWSGTEARKSSTAFLNMSTEQPVMLLMSGGNKLNNLHPLTPREISRAFLTAEGAVLA